MVLKPQLQLITEIIKPKANDFNEEQKISKQEIELNKEQIKIDGDISYKIDAINKLLKILVIKKTIFNNIFVEEQGNRLDQFSKLEKYLFGLLLS